MGEKAVDVKTSPISPIAINTADEVGDVLTSGVEFAVFVVVVVVDVEGVVVCFVGGLCMEGVVVGVCCVVLAPHTLLLDDRWDFFKTVPKTLISFSLSLIISPSSSFFVLLKVARACAQVTTITLPGPSLFFLSLLFSKFMLSLGGETKGDEYPKRRKRIASQPIQGDE